MNDVTCSEVDGVGATGPAPTCGEQLEGVRSARRNAVGTVPELIRGLEVAERVRLVVLGEPEAAHRILLQTTSVADIEVAHNSFNFVCHGGREAQAELLTQLVGAGLKVAQFAPIAQPLHEMVAAAPATPVSPDQTEP